VQKVTDVDWFGQIGRIYDAYTMYQQSGGEEQRVFDVGSGASAARSTRILDSVASHVNLPRQGRLLDVGCGNGSFLRAFSPRLPGWSSVGTELDDRSRSEIESISGVESLYTGPIAELDGTFSLISMVHVLEHIVGPAEMLEILRLKLRSGGKLIIEVPYYVDNPFDLMIADHASHFDPASISGLLERSGFVVELVAVDAVPRELLVIASAADEPRGETTPDLSLQEEVLKTRIDWLANCAESTNAAVNAMSLGIFGSSIAATWLYSAADQKVEFFVDEDPGRVGRSHLGRPIVSPDDVPDGSLVVVGLVPHLGAKVASRLSRPQVEFRPLPHW
jgi:SAM-dependent methyltransferase